MQRAGPRALGRVLSAPERAGVPSTSACGKPVATRSSPSLLPPRRGGQRAKPTRSPPTRSAPAVTAAARGPHRWRRGAVGFGALRSGDPGSGEQLTAVPGEEGARGEAGGRGGAGCAGLGLDPRGPGRRRSRSSRGPRRGGLWGGRNRSISCRGADSLSLPPRDSAGIFAGRATEFEPSAFQIFS